MNWTIAETPQFSKGLQIAYIPTHVLEETNGNLIQALQHHDTEFGFMMSQGCNGIFCRYWRVGHPGQLRTRANSECTPVENLIAYHLLDQDIVDRAIRQIEKETADAATLFG